ncbi:MAG: alpha-mannosidase [Roseburia sp.]|nr:alpha-mannosidase [Roseburia sp.]
MYDENLKQQTINKLAMVTKHYEELMYEKVSSLSETRFLITKEHLRRPPSDGLQPLVDGLDWGGFDKNLWVVGRIVIPECAAGKKVYALSHADGWEEMFWINGKPSGIFSWKNMDCTGGTHSAQLICVDAQPGNVYELAFECYAGHFPGGESRFTDEVCNPPTEESAPYVAATYRGVDICVLDEEVKEFVYDMYELISLNKNLEYCNMMKYQAIRALDDISAVVVQCPQHYEKAVWIEGIRKALAISRPIFREKGNRIFGRVGLIGHSHMDTAWLWEYKETIRKCARTFSNALSLMHQYPEYRFLQSSAIHGEWMKKYYPAVFEEMKAEVLTGRYVPNGGVYVECDCNIPSGESMIRQFLEGQTFTRENYGYTSDSFWLPDTFGYNANIPQIMKGCGIKYFFTQKLYGVELNPPSFETFWWRGIDASEVLCHFFVGGIVGDCQSVHSAVAGLIHKDSCDMHLLAFGKGDGGGGPTAGSLESLRRAVSCAGMPSAEYMTPTEFMEEAEQLYGNRLPIVDEELYYAYHRGTLTQMHEVKRTMRQAEFAARNAEYFSVLSGIPLSEEYTECYKNVLMNQFHDIIPGTAIRSVYETSEKEMVQNMDCFTRTIEERAKALVTTDANAITVFNTLPFERHDVLVLEKVDGVKGYPIQNYEDLLGRKLVAVGGVTIPAFSQVVLERSEQEEKDRVCSPSPFYYDGKIVETPFARVIFDENGYMDSFVDKTAGRELKKDGALPLNVFLVAEDCPEKWDNWNIESDTMANLKPVYGFKGREVVSDGVVELRLRSKYVIASGTELYQDVVFYADSPRVDFHTLIDWNSKHLLLKAGFDLKLRSREARNEIQYGHVLRPTHKSNSYDLAKFEVCMHKWTDISENRYGVALLSDCKYGISQYNCNLCLSLHRGGTEPDYSGDAGLHEMTYSLLPHNSGFNAPEVIYPAYELNVPTYAVSGRMQESKMLLEVDNEHVLCETVKPARREEHAFVLRLYECEGCEAQAKLKLHCGFKEVYRTNMLEDMEEALTVEDGIIELRLKAFEIVTLLVRI